MMTSRSEYRLLLRQDNADQRLTPKGYAVGLVSEERYAAFLEKQRMIQEEIARLQSTHGSPELFNPFLEKYGMAPLHSGASLADLLRRPDMTYAMLAEVDPNRPSLPLRVALTAEVSIKYEGYIKRQLREVERYEKLELKHLPADLDYASIKGLRIEAAQKLGQIRPATVGQASRISGVNPADISVLLIYLGMK